MDCGEYRCRDERTIAAPRIRCFETLIDLSTYSRWWTLVTVTPEAGSPRLTTGARFRFSGVHLLHRPPSPVLWNSIEKIHRARLQRVLGSDDHEPVPLDELLEDLGAVSQVTR